MKVVNNITELIGNTPVIKLGNITNMNMASIYAKMECFNPLSSIKDRICLNMLESAENNGLIKKGDSIVEPTSGNTGIGLAYIAAVKGYKLVLTMPDTMSVERRKIIKSFGAKIVLTNGADGMRGSIRKADELAKENNWFQPRQFENPANPEIHRMTTAKEILKQVPDLDLLIAGVGTGGTITGIGEVIKEKKGDKVKVIAVEPEDSDVLSGGKSGPHKIQGIGAGFIPDVLNLSIIDEVVKVSNENAFKAKKKLAIKEGIFVGISSGAAYSVAEKIALNIEKSKKIVVIFPDFGERYLSMEQE